MANYIKSVNKGLLKTFSKMGISTLQSYRGAQVFEAIGLNKCLVDKYFTGTSSASKASGLEVLAQEAILKHQHAFAPQTEFDTELAVGGNYQFRMRGEYHLYNPLTVRSCSTAVRNGKLRQLPGIHRPDRQADAPALHAARPARDQEVRRAGAAGRSGAGQGDRQAIRHRRHDVRLHHQGSARNAGHRHEPHRRQDQYRRRRRRRSALRHSERRSAIKQVASARFGVTTNYLVNADELQIKMAQGAKPGEGGQLPGHKVDEIIARVRHSIPGVGLISPPPHHDIYSIEDLAQLIYDLKNVNPRARISVKLVAEVGVGTVAAGVAKAHADVVLISRR